MERKKERKKEKEGGKKERVEWGNKIGKNKLKISKNARRIVLWVRTLIKIFSGYF